MNARAVLPIGSRLRAAMLSPRAARITAPLLALVVWQLATMLAGSRLLPTPLAVVEEAIELAVSGDVLGAFGASLTRLSIGLAIAVCLGSLLGLLMGLFSAVEAFLHDVVLIGLTIPYLIWGMLVSMWFGFGDLGPIVVVVLGATPFVMSNMAEGVRDVPRDLREMAHAYEVPGRRVIRHVVLPSLSPFFFAALRYGLANGWKGLVLAEVFAATSGAGWEIAGMRDYGNAAGVVAYALYFATFSVAVERIVFGRLSERVFRWRQSDIGMRPDARAGNPG